MSTRPAFTAINSTDSAPGGMAPAPGADGGAAGGAAPSGSEGGGAGEQRDVPGSSASSSAPSPQGPGSAGSDQPLQETGHAVDWSKYDAEVKRSKGLESRLEKLEREYNEAKEEIALARRVQQYVPQQPQAPVTRAQEAQAEDLFEKFVNGGHLTEREKELVTLVQQERQARQGLEGRFNSWEQKQAADKIRSEFDGVVAKYPDLPQDVLKSMCLTYPNKSISSIADELARHFDLVHESRMSKRVSAQPAAQAQQSNAPARSPQVVGTGASGKPAPQSQRQEHGESERDATGRFVKAFDDARSSAMKRFGLRG